MGKKVTITKTTVFFVRISQEEIRQMIKNRGYNIPDNTPIVSGSNEEVEVLFAEWEVSEILSKG